MRAYVALTDYEWFTYLHTQQPDEVNFWQPGGTRAFTAVAPGELLLFKLHSPRNVIAGGGFFAHSTLLPFSLAWDAFGTKNGARSRAAMRESIERLRRAPSAPHADYTIGCIVLVEPFFFDERDWIPVPPDFHPNTQQGKRYDLTTGHGLDLYNAVLERLTVPARRVVAEPQPVAFAEGAARRRLGQGAFRLLVTDNYERRCAVTGERTLPVLEAAHIRPVAEGGEHRPNNGLLLRSDLHTLFDRGYVGGTPAGAFLVSPRLRRDFENGRHYYAIAGTQLLLPHDEASRPDVRALEWHADTVYLG
jgi:putative restriction endonuclease